LKEKVSTNEILMTDLSNKIKEFEVYKMNTQNSASTAAEDIIKIEITLNDYKDQIEVKA
jgi:uncharacterized membrane protein YcgQ (UPF0703/DUF1980 family)